MTTHTGTHKLTYIFFYFLDLESHRVEYDCFVFIFDTLYMFIRYNLLL
jgi:hypothetical protein